MIQQQNEELPQQSPNFLLGKNYAIVTVGKLTHVVSQTSKGTVEELKSDENRTKNVVHVHTSISTRSSS